MRRNNLFPFVVLAASIIGIVDTAYLFMGEYVFHRGPACDFWGFSCDTVMKSSYSMVWGVPLAVWGLLYYGILFFACIAYFDMRKSVFVHFIMLAVAWGIVFSGWLVYIQAMRLHAWCLYCLISEVLAAVMGFALLISIYPVRIKKK
ncbi:MAG: hypothetical protein COV41_01085 [Candidatus Brennerbacteria bacterium CG11_big_fil_rev_8_21_14_0_20_43_10]|uniref:Vitamin K epoxide reductase domain-containing protein n=3 Tax=Candidatus Brenneribacteriota TaxID=1817902 RepID=A0A2M8C2X3_9BACT|nr:MAG: hypothetical protein AUJ43_01205 [Parcubacteria group bacterium CG1_02_44_31]PIP50521.1 MAG: hypothetical protein COX12_00890 [Candidatus Brennerbacteria bacterium CG23_combo_of_CG06-09_8_20_14_all_44_41]PIR26607.1 MAG: hypothetical protein COV41_01085 [Candidatus Brennerbacteria bacterium CG11_big_fil_rev_8_21_14_0_20_43_10]PIX29110.1 MAG: hypothetical protein COZ64_00920 [Candidatus Brennerbacteria bacterium CG_4_8_14_3_um_filter_43_14]PJA19790.1 MAG: hypothetical protein COX61_00245 